MQDFKFYIDSSKVGTITSIDRLVHLKRIHDEEETYRSMKFHAAERAELFAKFQRESIWMSGFRLDEEHLQIINEVISETVKKNYTKDEAICLYNAFKEMLRQAKEMKIDFLTELEQACKKVLLKRVLIRTNIFDE